jgi:large subunit ribosomal protein L19
MEAREIVPLTKNSNIAEFHPGDIVKVNVWIREGDRQRQQSFQGRVIGKRGGGPSSSFTVRRVAAGIGVERSFLFHSPNVASVDLMESGKVRRGKLYYLRGLSGRAARIKRRERPRPSRS